MPLSPSNCGEESFSVPYQRYIRYGGLRSTIGETIDYRGDKTKYDDPFLWRMTSVSANCKVANETQLRSVKSLNAGGYGWARRKQRS
jgi:hypothetical protein